jgi:hypothetical protein
MDGKNSAHGQVLFHLIRSHSESIRKRTVTCEATVCCHCGLDVASSQTCFVFHGTRARRFLVMIDSYVHRVAALLARWRCPQCRKTFTDYPPFACQHKAYTLPQMAERAAKYVNNTVTSYRNGVHSVTVNRPIYYEATPMGKSTKDHRSDKVASDTVVAHTSLFRWITTLGGDAQRQPEAEPTAFSPAPRKYTSEERRFVLIACQATCSVLLSHPAPAASHC